MAEPLLQIEDLSVAFDTKRGPVRPVNGLSLSLFPGQTLAVVGESGSGKSVTAMSILGLLPQPPGRVVGGRILFDGRDLVALPEHEMRRVRGKDIAMIFQEPMTSLNPVFTVGDQIVEAVTLHQGVHGSAAWDLAEQSLRDVGIADPGRRLREYPHQMSGGMRQRVMIAMALSCRPRLLIADEPTTALDVTIQAQILELLRELQRKENLAILLITHDLGVVAENADVVAVMYASRVVEYATVAGLFDHPQHPYTEGLFRSVPRLGRSRERLATIPGTVPNPASFPVGCKFHTRCQRTRDLAREVPDEQARRVTTAEGALSVMAPCVEREPELREVRPRQWARCHYAESYDRAPVTEPRLAQTRAEMVAEGVS